MFNEILKRDIKILQTYGTKVLGRVMGSPYYCLGKPILPVFWEFEKATIIKFCVEAKTLFCG